MSRNQFWQQTAAEKDFEDMLEKTLDQMTEEDMISFQTPEFKRAAAKGFLAGMLGPKQYEKNSWLELVWDPDRDIVPSLMRHIDQTRIGGLDPDTGLPDTESFIAARAIMYVTMKSRDRKNGVLREYEDKDPRHLWPPKPRD